jgi:hypothetical protein
MFETAIQTGLRRVRRQRRPVKYESGEPADPGRDEKPQGGEGCQTHAEGDRLE